LGGLRLPLAVALRDSNEYLRIIIPINPRNIREKIPGFGKKALIAAIMVTNTRGRG
jgi:hypothetical protein